MSMYDLINPFDKELLKQKIKESQPFPHFSFDNFLTEAFAEEIYKAFPHYTEAQKIGKEYNKVNEKQKIQITDSSVFPDPFKKLNNLLASQEFLDLMSELMDIPNLLADPELVGGGIHETNSGGHLDVHVDFNYLKDRQWHRRMNVLIYFNKDWKEDYGGYFDIWDKDVKKCYGSFAPLFNRIAAFATSEISYHGVTPVKCPKDVFRKSFAVYYYTKEAPAHWNGQHHSTIFKPRPDEWLKGTVFMPYEDTKKSIKGGIRKFKESIKGIVK